MIDPKGRFEEIKTRIEFVKDVRGCEAEICSGGDCEIVGFCDELMEEIEHGDYWFKRLKDFIEVGSCPVCLASDEEGYRPDCEWGKAEDEAQRYRDTMVTIVAISDLMQITYSTYAHDQKRIEQVRSMLKEALNMGKE
jgi:hypothetical protein